MLAVLALGQSASCAAVGQFCIPMLRLEPGDIVATAAPASLACELKRRLAHVGEDHRAVARHRGRIERNGNDGESCRKQKERLVGSANSDMARARASTADKEKPREGFGSPPGQL